MDLTQLTNQVDVATIALVGSVVWALTQMVKAMFPLSDKVDPRAIAILFSVLVAAVLVSGLISLDKVKLVGLIVAGALTAMFGHDKFYGGDTPA